MTSTDHAAAACLLRLLRESRGWSWTDLARALRDTARQLGMTSLMNCQVASIQRSIARWESTTALTRPGDRYQLLLAHLYAHTPGGGLASGPGSDFAVLLDALRQFGTTQQRIDHLAKLIAQGKPSDGGGELLALLSPATRASVAAALRNPQRADDELLVQLAGAVIVINEQVGSTPFVRLQLQLAPVVEICRRLAHFDQVEARDELMLLATNTFSLAARLAFETCADGVAVSLYGEAAQAAGQLSDRSHRAGVLTSHTMVTLHATGNIDAAGELARAALADAHRGTSYAIRARAHAVHAEVCARAGHGNQAHAALERAWTSVDQLKLDGLPSGFTAERLNGFDGLCSLHLGNANRADDRLARSIDSLSEPRDAVQRGINTTDLALARLRLGDPIACVNLLHRTVDVAASTGGRVPAMRIRQARQELRPWRTESFMADLDDHIHDSLIGR